MAGRICLRALSRLKPQLFNSHFVTANISHPQPAFTVLPHRVLLVSIHTTAVKFNEHIFNIQDEDDYKKRVLDNEKPVVVDFQASWCGPCKILGPRLESLVGEQGGSVLLAKVDIDDNQELAIDNGVEAVPTVIAVKGGKVVDKFVGVIDEAALDSFIRNLTE